MSNVSICAIYITVPTAKDADLISRHLLKMRLAACANIFKITSLYWWNGEIENCPEYAIILKTKKRLVKELIKETKKFHSYQVPCIVAWNIAEGDLSFLKWARKETK